MAYGDLLIHTCTIEEAETALDEYGEREVDPSWALYERGVRCRLVEDQQRIAQEGGVSYALITTYRLLTLPSLGLRADRRYRVVDVRTYGGELVDAGPFTIESRLQRRGRAAHHQTLELQKVG